MPYPPVWFMRQAGRSLPEYRAGSGRHAASSSRSVPPELAAELTLQPVRRYGVDAAILFSDIVVPLAAIGFGVEIHAGVGPVAAEPFRAPPTWTGCDHSNPRRTPRRCSRPYGSSAGNCASP